MNELNVQRYAVPDSGDHLAGQYFEMFHHIEGGVQKDKTRAGGERSLVVPIATPLDPGAYTMAWKTAGDDGHTLQGTVDFSVKAKTAPASK